MNTDTTQDTARHLPGHGTSHGTSHGTGHGTGHGAGHGAGHLTEDQLDEVLLNVAEPGIVAHAGACPLCSRRLEDFRTSVAVFNQASRDWSQARSNTLPRNPAGRRNRSALNPLALWSYASAGVVAAVLLAAIAVERHAATPQAAAQFSSAQSSSGQGSDYARSHQIEIANDNAMLAAISSELSRPDPVPPGLYDEPGIPQPRQDALRQARD